ncbi:MAG: hypothetical protein M0R30_05255 [Methanoregula sp.]|uniref:hypothetical protein n=1 Tax=Methanoregula sp. TaxID=2052170 RepID=UPI0025F90707|nr:hypothetical protein [Methanoregula sp.]MCK9631031.1 hypothetical protein [Methanoregula sp.]
MNTPKTWFILLALMLAAMAMVPMVSACEGSAGCESNKSSQSYQTPEVDLFAELGVEKPMPSAGPAWQTYDSSKNAVDDIISKSGKQNDVGRVIGYLKGKSERVVLYKGLDGNHYVLLEKDEKVVTKSVKATVLGSIEKKDIEVASSDNALNAIDKSTPTTSYELRKISLSEIGSSEFGTKTIYETHILRTDSWVSAFDPNKRADLFTEGTFTYDGSQILDIVDNTNSNQDFGIDRCEFTHSTRTTSLKGYIESHVIWALLLFNPPKHSVDAWISCSVTGVPGGGRAVSEWVSSGFGCFGTP